MSQAVKARCAICHIMNQRFAKVSGESLSAWQSGSSDSAVLGSHPFSAMYARENCLSPGAPKGNRNVPAWMPLPHDKYCRQVRVSSPRQQAGSRLAPKSELNDWEKAQYGGPCPPIGRHRYIHKLYALDIQLPELRRPTKAEVERAMNGHILAEIRLIGTYQKGG